MSVDKIGNYQNESNYTCKEYIKLVSGLISSDKLMGYLLSNSKRGLNIHFEDKNKIFVVFY